MHILPILTVLCLAFAGTASAQVDPLNWCLAPIGIPVAASREPLRPAYTIVATRDVAASRISPGGQVAIIETRDAPRRAVVSADSALGFQTGQALAPFWVVEGQTDAMSLGVLAYCAISDRTDPRSRERLGACVRGLNAAGASQSGFQAGFRGNEDDRDFMGFMRGNEPRDRDWATLGPELETPPATRSRRLIAGAYHVYRQPAFDSRPAYNSITVDFQLEDTPLFRRQLNQPIRIEDGWLAVTDFAADGTIALTRMSDSEWTIFQTERCPRLASS